jgi:hypothetical protein
MVRGEPSSMHVQPILILSVPGRRKIRSQALVDESTLTFERRLMPYVKTVKCVLKQEIPSV